MKKQQIATNAAPGAIGPYSQAVRAGQLVYTSGQIPIDPKSGSIAVGGIVEQTRQVLENLGAVLKAADSSFAQVLKTTVFLKDMGDFAAMNGIYEEYFRGTVFPARSAVQVAKLPKDVMVEIEAVAMVTEA